MLSVPSSFGLQRSPSSQASVPSSYLLNSCAEVQLHDVVLKSWGEMLYKDCDTFFYCDQSYKMSQSNPGGRLAVEDGESLRAWACGCNITRESKSKEVKMFQTWVCEQVAFDYRWSNNDLYSKTIQRHTHAGLRVNSGFLQAVTDETNEVNVKCFPSKVQFGLVDLAQCSPHPATQKHLSSLIFSFY